LTNKEPYRKLKDNSWLITVQENGKDKELYIELPPETLNQMGWDEGDTLIWKELTDGAWQVTKKETDDE
jgi:hypothetical protein